MAMNLRGVKRDHAVIVVCGEEKHGRGTGCRLPLATSRCAGGEYLKGKGTSMRPGIKESCHGIPRLITGLVGTDACVVHQQ